MCVYHCKSSFENGGNRLYGRILGAVVGSRCLIAETFIGLAGRPLQRLEGSGIRGLVFPVRRFLRILPVGIPVLYAEIRRLESWWQNQCNRYICWRVAPFAYFA